MSADFAAIRLEEFPSLADVIYLNSASIGPLPERTRRRLDRWEPEASDRDAVGGAPGIAARGIAQHRH